MEQKPQVKKKTCSFSFYLLFSMTVLILGLFLIKELLGFTRIRIRENGVYGSGVRFWIEIPEDKFRFIP